jgi:hypothetical protein
VNSNVSHNFSPIGAAINRILELDAKLTPLFADLERITEALEMPLVCALSDEKTISEQVYSGIYRIDVSTTGSSLMVGEWIQTLRTEWEHDDFKKKFTPNFKEKRIAQHKVLPEWMPLYLGKSKNVGARVLEHINLPLHKTTFALKLKARPSMSTRSFRLHTLKLPVKNYDLIVPALEAALRNRFHPLIGKQ